MESSIFGKFVIDVQKIQSISIQKKQIDKNLSGTHQKIFIIINLVSESIEYSFELDDQEKSLTFFREIEKNYYAILKNRVSLTEEEKEIFLTQKQKLL